MALLVTNEPATGRIFQRAKETRHRSGISLNGTHTNATAVSVQYQIKEGAATRVNWRTLGAVSVGATSWSGYLNHIPCQNYAGDWYTLNLRTVNVAGTVLETFIGAKTWAVGAVFTSAGQSLIEEWNSKGTLARSGISSTATYSGGFTYVTTTAGQGCVAFANAMGVYLDMPIMFFSAAVGGSALSVKYEVAANGWWDPVAGPSWASTILVPGLQEMGTGIEGLIWSQGESDAAQSALTVGQYYTGTEYGAMFDRWWREMLEIIPDTPLYYYPLGRTEAGWAISNLNHAGIRQYQTGNRQNQFSIADHYDIVHDGGNTDIYHLTGPGYQELAERCALVIQEIHERGQIVTSTGPKITHARFANAAKTVVDVFVQHMGGKSLAFQTGTPNTACWLALNDNGYVLISAVQMLGPSAIRLTISAALTGVAEMTYIHGSGEATLWNDGCVEDDRGVPMRPAPRPFPIADYGG